MTIEDQVRAKFPVGSRFYSIGLDSMFTVESIESEALIAWMDSDKALWDADVRDSEGEPLGSPTRLPFDYMLNPDRARTESEWSALSDAERAAIWEKHWGKPA